MQPKIPQYELSFVRSTFNLIVDQTQDGERLARESEQRERAAKEQAEKHKELTYD